MRRPIRYNLCKACNMRTCSGQVEMVKNVFFITSTKSPSPSPAARHVLFRSPPLFSSHKKVISENKLLASRVHTQARDEGGVPSHAYAASSSLAPGGHSHPHPTGHVARPTALHAADNAACSSKSARGAPSRTGQASGSDRAAARSAPAKGAPVKRDRLHSAAWHAGLLRRGVRPRAPLRQPAHAERRVPSRAHSEPSARRPARGLVVRAAAARSARWAAGRATAPRCRTRLGARVPAAAPA